MICLTKKLIGKSLYEIPGVKGISNGYFIIPDGKFKFRGNLSINDFTLKTPENTPIYDPTIFTEELNYQGKTN